MNDTIQAIKHELKYREFQLSDYSTAVAYLTAEALGQYFAIPTSTVENPYAYFRSTYLDELKDRVSQVNEEIVVDVDEVIELSLKLWILRYRLVHDSHAASIKSLLATIARDSSYSVPARYADLLDKYPTLTRGTPEAKIEIPTAEPHPVAPVTDTVEE